MRSGDLNQNRKMATFDMKVDNDSCSGQQLLEVECGQKQSVHTKMPF